jgi:hypothetical protein
MDFETVDFLLRRNWFVFDEDIVDLLWLLDEEDYARVVQNYKTYAFNIQEAIDSIP